MNYRARAEKEQRLEEGVGHEVKDGCRISRYAATEEHVSKLRNRGVSQHALDVVLRQAYGCGKECRGRAHDSNDAEREGRAVKEEVEARNHVNAGRDHGGGVDERGDRCGALHGVGQPDVERKLRAFTGCAYEQAEADGGEDASGPCGISGQFRGQLTERERAEVGEKQENADEETE